MKNKRHDGRDRSGRQSDTEARHGLANESRPGLGPRTADNAVPTPQTPPSQSKSSMKGKPRATKRGYDEPRPEPREQAPDTMEHDQERSTGMSGQSSGT